MIGGGGYCVFRIELLRIDDIGDGFVVVFILHHHLVDFKYGSAGFSHFLAGFFIQLLQFLESDGFGLLQPFQLCLGIFNVAALDHQCFPGVKRNAADGNASIHTLPLNGYHAHCSASFP